MTKASCFLVRVAPCGQEDISERASTGADTEGTRYVPVGAVYAASLEPEQEG